MIAQYRYVGPVLHVLNTMPEMAAWCSPSEGRAPDTIWIDLLNTWARIDGTWVSGWDEGEYFAFRPHWLNRFKLRRAANRFARRKPPSPLPG